MEMKTQRTAQQAVSESGNLQRDAGPGVRTYVSGGRTLKCRCRHATLRNGKHIFIKCGCMFDGLSSEEADAKFEAMIGEAVAFASSNPDIAGAGSAGGSGAGNDTQSSDIGGDLSDTPIQEEESESPRAARGNTGMGGTGKNRAPGPDASNRHRESGSPMEEVHETVSSHGAASDHPRSSGLASKALTQAKKKKQGDTNTKFDQSSHPIETRASDDSEPVQRRILPDREVKKKPFSKSSYRLSDDAVRTGICMVDADTAFEMGALETQIDEGVTLPKDICALLNNFLNSAEADKQIKALFPSSVLKKGGYAKTKKSLHAGESFDNGLFATRDVQGGTLIVLYGGFILNFEESKRVSEEKVCSDRKAVIDVKITNRDGSTDPHYLMMVGWENAGISKDYPLVSGHIMNHSCIPNCEMIMVSLTFMHEGVGFEVSMPAFKVCDDFKVVKKGDEFTFDYGSEMACKTPFVEEAHQESIKSAYKSTNGDNERMLGLLKRLKVPLKINPEKLVEFLQGSDGTPCSCTDCDDAEQAGFDRSVLNIGSNTTDTAKLREFLNYTKPDEDGSDTSISDPRESRRSDQSRARPRLSRAQSKSVAKTSASLKPPEGGSTSCTNGGSPGMALEGSDFTRPTSAASKPATAVSATSGSSGVRKHHGGGCAQPSGYKREYKNYALIAFSDPNKPLERNRRDYNTTRAKYDQSRRGGAHMARQNQSHEQMQLQQQAAQRAGSGAAMTARVVPSAGSPSGQRAANTLASPVPIPIGASSVVSPPPWSPQSGRPGYAAMLLSSPSQAADGRQHLDGVSAMNAVLHPPPPIPVDPNEPST